MSGWQLESSSAEAYERYAVASWSRALAEELVALAAPQPGERVLDVACGTGVVARLAAERLGDSSAVVGLDLNEDMLAVAAASDGTRPITWRQGDAAAMPFGGGAFDVVLCQQALQFFPDRGAALREMHRALAPGGRLALSVMRSIEHNAGWGALADAIERHAGAEAGAMMRSPFPDWESTVLHELVGGAGFEDVRVGIVVASARYPSPAELVRWKAASSPLAGPLGALQPERLEALVADVAAALREHTGDDGVIFPQETHVVLARRADG